MSALRNDLHMPTAAVASIDGKVPVTQGIDPARLREVREGFARRGESIRAWAKRNGYKHKTVSSILSGDRKALRGISHQIAVDLGLKDGEAAND